MKCLECLKNVSLLNKLRLFFTSDRINCDRCGCELKLKHRRWVIVFDLIQYTGLLLIGILLYRENFALYIIFLLLFWIEWCFFLNIVFNRVEKVN